MKYIIENYLIEIQNERIMFKHGIDKKFFEIMWKLYRPFLTSANLKDKYQYSIYMSNKLIGFIQIGTFIQIALIPSERGKNLVLTIIKLILNKLNIDKIGWSSNKFNYPSMKTLYNLGGGIYYSSLNPKRKSIEGVLKRKKLVIEKYRKMLESLLPQSKIDYIKWKKGFDNRKMELQKLDKYLSGSF